MLRRPLAVTLLAACVADPRYTTDEQALVGAPLDATHGYAVGICHTDATCEKDSAGHCSGNLIAPNLVLTARHCVDAGRQLAPAFCDTTFLGQITPAHIHVTTHPDPYGAGSSPIWYTAKQVLVPEDDTLCASDLALIILDKNIPAAEAEPASVDLTESMVGDTVAIVGRGAIDVKLVMIGTSYVPETVDDGNYRRRILENIPVLCALDSTCTLPDFTEPSGSFTTHPSHLVVGPSTFPGDSGAGIVAQSSIAGPAPVVLAVTSAGSWGSPTEPNATFGVRLKQHAALIAEAAHRAAKSGGYAPPAWAEGIDVPDDGDGGGCRTSHSSPSALAVAIALAIGLGRRRRVSCRATGRPCRRACRPATGSALR